MEPHRNCVCCRRRQTLKPTIGKRLKEVEVVVVVDVASAEAFECLV